MRKPQATGNLVRASGFTVNSENFRIDIPDFSEKHVIMKI